jgi:hypothetical protein
MTNPRVMANGSRKSSAGNIRNVSFQNGVNFYTTPPIKKCVFSLNADDSGENQNSCGHICKSKITRRSIVLQSFEGTEMGWGPRSSASN